VGRFEGPTGKVSSPRFEIQLRYPLNPSRSQVLPKAARGESSSTEGAEGAGKAVPWLVCGGVGQKKKNKKKKPGKRWGIQRFRREQKDR